jgi:NitT/TauT family transport system permease protein
MITRPAVPRPSSWFSDLSVVAVLAALLYGVVRVSQHWQAPLQPRVDIDLSLWALPGYTLLSLLRGVAAYGVSLAVALGYGYAAAHRPRAERLLLPLLDVLQSIPVLGFLPGAILVLVALFPGTNAGLELASILMIVTSQVWNLAFSFYQSLRGIPLELREASQLYQFNWWQRFRRVELPAAAVGLAWNSMMAMAGGWFFLMICESFTLGSHDFRLPGLGAYMSVAISQRRVPAILAGLAAMVLMIVLVDLCVWRPVLVWVQKFRVEDTAAAGRRESLILSWLSRSWLTQAAMAGIAHPLSEWLASRANPPQEASVRRRIEQQTAWLWRVLSLVLSSAAGGLILWAAARLVQLLVRLTAAEWVAVVTGAVLTCLRVAAAVALGSLWVIPAGIWIGRSERWRSRLQPLVQIAASFPAPMLYPLILLSLHALGWGLGVGSVLFMLIGTQWYILFNVIAGASAVPTDLQEAARAYHFTPGQRWRVIWWPAVFPYLITGWITAAGGAWNASIVAEYVAVGPQVSVTNGLGSLISLAAGQGRYDLLSAGVLAMAVLVVFINRYLWKPLYRLAETRYAY